ncbi:syntaxin-10 isoform X2 [Dermochelys coriacea]|uniref:syntaxin-10 isoform X2 n=1 Tax=Dermochelys coriacea TaxID=27794 RepID=UPI001CAA1CCF|nr:syntaxin-10 isoform X2 [Dermochelys coriacea]
MALEDPFSAVRREVQKAVNTARGLYGRWCELLQETRVVSAEEFDWTTNELHNSLRSIEWDLEDLEETIRIVDSNPRKFRIEASELTERRAFVKQMRDSVKEMRDHVSSPSALAVTERKNREMLIGGGASQKPPLEQYGPLRAELVSANSRYIEEQQLHQQLIIDQQDEQLELVSGSIRVLKHMSGQVGDELEEQSLMLEEFAQEMDSTQSRMDGVLKKMAKVSHMTSETKINDDGNKRETNPKAAKKPRCRLPTQIRKVKSRLERKLKPS